MNVFSQLSLWEFGVLLLVIGALNWVLLKWFKDWNQSNPLDEAEVAGATPGPTQARAGEPALADSRIGGGTASATAKSSSSPEAAGGGGLGSAADRPRRRKYLQPTTDNGGSGAPASAQGLPASSRPAAAAAATAPKEDRDLAPVATLTKGPKLTAPAAGVALSGRSFAEANPAAGPAESGKPAGRPLISAAGLPPARPSSDLAASVAAAAATPARPADEPPAKERTPASRLWDRTSSSVPARSTPISRSEILAKEGPRVSPLQKVSAPAPAAAERAAGTGSGLALPATEPVRAAVPAPAVVPSAGLSTLVGPSRSEAPAPTAPEAPAPELTDTLTLSKAGSDPADASSAPAARGTGSEMRDDKAEPPAPLPALASSLAAPELAPATPVVAPAADLLLQKEPATQHAAAERHTDENNAAEKSAAPEPASTPAPVAAAAEPPPPAEPPVSSADFAPMPTPTSTDETPAETRGAPGGRPIIARRSVGPARIFLTREFSSLRIKSALNPPQTPALAAARARQTPPPTITPVVSAGAPEPTAETTVGKAAASDYEPIGEAATPAATSEPTPSASLQLRAMPPSSAESGDEPARAEAAATAEASSAATKATEERPETVSAPTEELPAVAAGALGSESGVETVQPATPAATETPADAAAGDDHSTPAPAAEMPAYAAVEPTPPAEERSSEREEGLVSEDVPASEVDRPTGRAEEADTAPAPTAGLMETPRHSISESESAAPHVEPVDIAPAPAMLPPVSSSGSSPAATAPETIYSTVRPSASSTFLMTSAPTSSGERAIAQLTFSFEVASLQLTPAFRLGSVQLRPLTNVVTLHLNQGEGQGGQGPLSANIAFEILQTQTGGSSGHGPIQALVLKPLSEARAATTPQPKLAVNAVQLSQGTEGNAPIQITPAQNTSTSVQVLATFAIAGIDFTPLFEIGSMRLEPTTANVLLKLSQGAGGSGMELPPSFVLTDVEVGGDGQISSMLLVPRAS